MSLISNAFAATPATTTTAGVNFMSFLPMVVIFILFWFLLIRPQQKKAKIHNKMLSELQKDDEVLTNSGILGKTLKITEQFIVLEVANGVNIAIQKNTISTKVEKGTIAKV